MKNYKIVQSANKLDFLFNDGNCYQLVLSLKGNYHLMVRVNPV